MPRVISIFLITSLCGCASDTARLGKSQWVLALFRNDSAHSVTVAIRAASAGESVFVAPSGQVRETEVSGEDREICVFPDIGPHPPKPGTPILARCTINFRQL